MGPGLFQDPDWPDRSRKLVQGTVSYGNFLCAVLKTVLTPEEASYCFLGPPTTTQRAEWFCCMAPCRVYQTYQSVNMFTMAFLTLLSSMFLNVPDDFFSNFDAARQVVDEFPGLLTREELLKRGRSNYFEPLLLIPVRKLPRYIRKGLSENFPREGKKNLGNLFVCPSHFGFLTERGDKSLQSLKSFSFAGFKLQLIHEPFGFVCYEALEGGKPLNPETTRFQKKLASINARGGKTQKLYPHSATETFVRDEAEAKLKALFLGLENSTWTNDQTSDRVLFVDSHNQPIPPSRISFRKKNEKSVRFTSGEILKKLIPEVSKRLRVLVHDFDAMVTASQGLGQDIRDLSPYLRYEWGVSIHGLAVQEGLTSGEALSRLSMDQKSVSRPIAQSAEKGRTRKPSIMSTGGRTPLSDTKASPERLLLTPGGVEESLFNSFVSVTVEGLEEKDAVAGSKDR